MGIKTNNAMKTHTPGPWTVRRLEAQLNEANVWQSPIGQSRADHRRLTAVAFGKTNYEAEANARLIAAAPELLEALIAIYKLAESENKKVESLLYSKFVSLSYKAIAKATENQ